MHTEIWESSAYVGWLVPTGRGCTMAREGEEEERGGKRREGMGREERREERKV